ncbi:PqqD family protein [Streptomyces sp. HNM0663]|uniref:PqqD family protein n=1 Tax=Streptomyces chengmaiensis TaxID=3040919 RepID=A0ABT6HZ18_9ACTN|nr:PqqD family protein [Streptomyces chengmaiensis]MDH2393915.1 PqqD family protein [Streptomyces chengmaiensis]
MLTPAPHVHHATGPYGTAVLDIRRGTWLMLDPEASKIWHAVTVRGGTAGLADEIAVPTGQDPQQVGEQITAFVNALVTTGVLVDTARPARRKRRWRR